MESEKGVSNVTQDSSTDQAPLQSSMEISLGKQVSINSNTTEIDQVYNLSSNSVNDTPISSMATSTEPSPIVGKINFAKKGYLNNRVKAWIVFDGIFIAPEKFMRIVKQPDLFFWQEWKTGKFNSLFDQQGLYIVPRIHIFDQGAGTFDWSCDVYGYDNDNNPYSLLCIEGERQEPGRFNFEVRQAGSGKSKYWICIEVAKLKNEKEKFTVSKYNLGVVGVKLSMQLWRWNTITGKPIFEESDTVSIPIKTHADNTRKTAGGTKRKRECVSYHNSDGTISTTMININTNNNNNNSNIVTGTLQIRDKCTSKRNAKRPRNPETDKLYLFLDAEAMLGYGDSNYRALRENEITLKLLFMRTSTILDSLRDVIPSLQIKLLGESLKRSLEIGSIRPPWMACNATTCWDDDKTLTIHSKYIFPEGLPIEVRFGSPNPQTKRDLVRDAVVPEGDGTTLAVRISQRICKIPDIREVTGWLVIEKIMKDIKTGTGLLPVGKEAELPDLPGTRVGRSKENEIRLTVPITIAIGTQCIDSGIKFTYVYNIGRDDGENKAQI